MTDEEMIDELMKMKHTPSGLTANKTSDHWFALSTTEGYGSSLLCSWMKGLMPMQVEWGKLPKRRDYYTNKIGEHLRTLYEKCKEYNTMKIKEEEDKKARNRERAIQLIKDL